MADFISTLKLRPKLEAAKVFVEGENFEVLYSRLAEGGCYKRLIEELEECVLNYFAELRLPKEPTVYDHLLLSLRPKDTVATFNWDPFLYQACKRCKAIAKPPLCLGLHGNVAIGYCNRHHPMQIGIRGGNCQKCGNSLIVQKLLYPVAQKDYAVDPLISESWQAVQQKLAACFLLTIFGYSAPKTDANAVKLMKKGWGDPNVRSLEETEIIDTSPEDDLYVKWKPFILRDHYRTHTSFYDSMLACMPRRSVEAMFAALVDREEIDYFPIPKDADWNGLKRWIQPFREQENTIGE